MPTVWKQLVQKVGNKDRIGAGSYFSFKKKKLTNNNSECLSLIRARVSNTRPGGQKQPGTDSSRAHWVALENVKEGINVGLLTVFSSVLQLLQFNSYNFSLSIIEI